MHQQTSPTPKILYSISEFQAATGLSRTKTYELIATGDLISVQVGRRRLVPADAVHVWLNKLRGQHASTINGGSDVR